MDGVNQIYALLAAFGESHSRLLLDAVLIDNANKEHVLQLVQIMLDSTGTPGRYPLDEHCSHLAFSFWYYYPIYDQLILNNHLNSILRYILQDDICSSSSEKHKTYRALFGPAYLALIDVLMTKSMISIDQSEWSPDDKETFRCYRQVSFYLKNKI